MRRVWLVLFQVGHVLCDMTPASLSLCVSLQQRHHREVKPSDLSSSSGGHLQSSQQSWLILRHFCRGRKKEN